MTEKAVKDIYDKLFHWEGKDAAQPYPIHKKLEAHFGSDDIYEWISKTYAFNSSTEVLDAGCGVGYGSFYLSKKYNCKVTGISLSEAEVKKANLFVKNQNSDDNVIFKEQSFDTLKPNSFDFILAVESIKHTLDINKTIGSLKNALRPNGILLVVDDFLVNESSGALISRYTRDWVLKVVLKYDNFKPEFVLKKDLTPFVRTKNRLHMQLAILILSIGRPFFKIAKIMRGGLYLEKMFKQNMMHYYILEYKKTANS